MRIFRIQYGASYGASNYILCAEFKHHFGEMDPSLTCTSPESSCLHLYVYSSLLQMKKKTRPYLSAGWQRECTTDETRCDAQNFKWDLPNIHNTPWESVMPHRSDTSQGCRWFKDTKYGCASANIAYLCTWT